MNREQGVSKIPEVDGELKAHEVLGKPEVPGSTWETQGAWDFWNPWGFVANPKCMENPGCMGYMGTLRFPESMGAHGQAKVHGMDG